MKTAFLFIALFLFAHIACNKLLKGQSNVSAASNSAPASGPAQPTTAQVPQRVPPVNNNQNSRFAAW
jgi:hypothetical protein